MDREKPYFRNRPCQINLGPPVCARPSRRACHPNRPLGRPVRDGNDGGSEHRNAQIDNHQPPLDGLHIQDHLTVQRRQTDHILGREGVGLHVVLFQVPRDLCELATIAR